MKIKNISNKPIHIITKTLMPDSCDTFPDSYGLVPAIKAYERLKLVEISFDNEETESLSEGYDVSKDDSRSGDTEPPKKRGRAKKTTAVETTETAEKENVDAAE